MNNVLFIVSICALTLLLFAPAFDFVFKFIGWLGSFYYIYNAIYGSDN